MTADSPLRPRSETGPDLLAPDGPPPTLLPDDVVVRAAVQAATGSGSAADADALASVAAAHPTSSLVWAALSEQALDAGHPVPAYAYARTGYHRGLDALRRGGWRGQGPVPGSHPGNKGFLRALAALAAAAAAIGESVEADRCAVLLRDCDPTYAAGAGR